jgi:hypothetical protein
MFGAGRMGCGGGQRGVQGGRSCMCGIRRRVDVVAFRMIAGVVCCVLWEGNVKTCETGSKAQLQDPSPSTP